MCHEDALVIGGLPSIHLVSIDSGSKPISFNRAAKESGEWR